MNLYELGEPRLLEVADLADQLEDWAAVLDIPGTAVEDIKRAAAELRNYRATLVTLSLAGCDASADR